VRDFRRLTVWAQAHGLTLDVYQATADFPADEQFGLVVQARRAAVSVAANIAEGCGRHSEPDFRRFLTVAMGSASELEYHLLLAYDLRMLGQAEHEKLRADVIACKRMLGRLIARIDHGHLLAT